MRNPGQHVGVLMLQRSERNIVGALKVPPGMQPDRGMELELETGDAPVPRPRPVKRLSDGELAELRTQLIDLLDRCWNQHSPAGQDAAVVFARKPDGTWRICNDNRGLNAITRPAIIPHIDALLAGTRGSTPGRVSLPSWISPLVTISSGCGPQTGDRRASGRRWAVRVPVECVPFGLQGESLLIRVMHRALTVGLDFSGGPSTAPSHRTPRQDLASLHGGLPGASGPLGRCALVYMDDCLVHSPTLEQHLLGVAELLEIYSRPIGSFMLRAPSASSRNIFFFPCISHFFRHFKV